MVPISGAGGTFAIGDSSNIVEYALKMQRISEDHMLYRLLAQGKAGEEELEARWCSPGAGLRHHPERRKVTPLRQP